MKKDENNQENNGDKSSEINISSNDSCRPKEKVSEIQGSIIKEKSSKDGGEALLEGINCVQTNSQQSDNNNLNISSEKNNKVEAEKKTGVDKSETSNKSHNQDKIKSKKEKKGRNKNNSTKKSNINQEFNSKYFVFM